MNNSVRNFFFGRIALSFSMAVVMGFAIYFRDIFPNFILIFLIVGYGIILKIAGQSLVRNIKETTSAQEAEIIIQRLKSWYSYKIFSFLTHHFYGTLLIGFLGLYLAKVYKYPDVKFYIASLFFALAGDTFTPLREISLLEKIKLNSMNPQEKQ